MANQTHKRRNARIMSEWRRRYMSDAWWKLLAAVLAAALLCLPAPGAMAEDSSSYTRETFERWFSQYRNARPDFKPGDVLTSRDIERMRPFVPPGYLEQLNFPEARLEVAQPRNHPLAQAYSACTEKYGAQVKLASDGAPVNYRCGQPFAQLDPGDPRSGIKAAWDFDYHWDNYGLNILNVLWIWVRNGGTHEKTEYPVGMPPGSLFEGIDYTTKLPTDVAHDFGGGGTFQRSLASYYQRVRFSHLAQLDGGSLPLTGAEDWEWKEISYFYEPFDIRGTAFVIFRREDPHLAESAWAYVPNLRRVRRVTSEVKSDSLLGTDMVLDDFYGFNGKPLDWNWKFWGFKDILAVTDSRQDYMRLYGPNGTIPDDQWSLRRVLVLERVPKDSRYPYSSALMFVDAETWFALYHFAFDTSKKLWKTNQWQWRYSEDAKEFSEVNHGAQTMYFQGAVTTDVQNGRASIYPAYGSGYPSLHASQVGRLYDVNKLEEIHR